jgi:hypothetical protein
MDLEPYVAGLREQLSVAAGAAGPEAQQLADRLIAPLDASARLALLEALTAAAAEITQELAPGSVEVRLRGRDPEFVVTPPASPADVAPTSAPADLGYGSDDAEMARINLRLPQDLKERVEDAARASGISVNAWLVRCAGGALANSAAVNGPTHASGSRHQRYSGWVR